MNTISPKIDCEEVGGRLAHRQFELGESVSTDRDRLAIVLRERARQLALRGQKVATQASGTPVVIVRLGDERFGFHLANLSQVFFRVPITPVPGASELVLGIANLNGALRSVIDLRTLLQLPATRTAEGYIALLRAGRFAATWVDQVEDVRDIDLGALALVDQASSNSQFKVTKGITSDGIVVLDTRALIDGVTQTSRAPLPKRG